MTAYTVSHLALDAGVSVHVVRDYLLRGLLRPAACTTGGYGLFDAAASETRHMRMLRVAVALRDWHEVRGQLLRIALVPFGHLLGRLPRGNTGASNVSAFAPMTVQPALERLLDTKES